MPLSAQTNVFGDGVTQGGPPPSRLQSFTPAADSARNKSKKDALLSSLSPLLTINEKWKSMCNDPDSIVDLHVKPEDEKKVFKQQYPLAHAAQPHVTRIVARWLAEGKIKKAPPNTRFNSPLLAVPKKDDDGKMTDVRLCLDVRLLNDYLVEDDKQPIPRIPDVLAKFAGSKLFGEFDLSEAYFQFKLREQAQKYTAFTWGGQQYVFVGCPFGIKHIPSFFQRYIANLFHDMPFVYPYLDNLGFGSSSWEEHAKHARMIIQRLNDVQLRIKPSSYNVGNTQLRLLGHVLNEQGVVLDPEKVEMIQAWPKPTTGAAMASCLGLATFLRDHCRHYADVCAPLEAAKSQKQIIWTEQMDNHWHLFKRMFVNAPILRFPDFNKRFCVACDASQTGVGGVIYQPDDDNNTLTAHNIVGICSKQLNSTQRNYPIYKKELWGLIYCLRKFHSFIWGRRDVVIHTDHKPLVHILKQKTMTVSLQQWVDVLLDYDLSIQYRPGVLHVVPDALSRMYSATYCDNTLPWGTVPNITILANFDKTATSPSDFLCQQSLDAIKPLSAVKARHRVGAHTGTGGGEGECCTDDNK